MPHDAAPHSLADHEPDDGMVRVYVAAVMDDETATARTVATADDSGEL
ncbi:MAG: hypothetical protein JWQ77_3112 [Jatrophihabitans sp.]|nr:hypothetical protein [Jatrophihabitans sp.]